MEALLIGIGLAIAFEGAAWALAPRGMREAVDWLFAGGERRVRIFGAVAFTIGSAFVLLTKAAG
ncbi:MAG: DUF2065 domain-containing protein [Pacificimonas sp.]